MSAKEVVEFVLRLFEILTAWPILCSTQVVLLASTHIEQGQRTVPLIFQAT